MTTPTIIESGGRQTEIKLDVEMYREAYDQGMTLPQYLNNRFDCDYERDGTPFEQLLRSSKFYLQRDTALGLRPPKLADVINGKVDVNMGAIARPDGSQALTPAGRFLFPAVMMQLVEHELSADYSNFLGLYNRMVALTESVDSPRADQPIINVTAPRSYKSQPVAQLTEPPKMVTISLSDKSYKIPTFSIGLEISAEAAKASAIDLVAIALKQQAEYERISRTYDTLSTMISGDADLGITALPSENAASYDATATSPAAFSNRAWIKWLMRDWTKLTIDWVICDIDTYLAVENRVGRPIQTGDQATDNRLTTIPTAANPGLPTGVNFFIVDTAVVGANTMIGIDSRKAIRKVIYTGGSYQAVEEFVLRKSTAMRFDFAEASFRLLHSGEGWKKLIMQ
jgi:hypothetical protein